MNRIAFVLVGVLPFPNVKGGAIETLLTSLADENEKYHNFDIDIYSIYDENAKKKSEKYKYTRGVYIKESIIRKFIYRVLQKLQLTLFTDYYKRCYNKIKRSKYDLIIFEGGPTDGHCQKEFAKFAPIGYHLHYNGYPPRKDDSYKYLIGVSDFVNREWHKISPVQIAYTVRNGIDLHKFQKGETFATRNDLGISDDDFVAIYVGRIIEVKGIYELLCAVEKINISGFKLLIIGSANFATKSNTDFEKKIKEKIDSLGEKIVFTGYIPNDRLYPYYKMADIQIIPSMWEEAAGLVAIEGMAAGLPIIATKSGGMVEYVNAECATLIDRGTNIVDNIQSAIIDLYHNPAKRKAMSLAGIKHAENFTDAIFYRNMSETIKSIIKK